MIIEKGQSHKKGNGNSCSIKDIDKGKKCMEYM